MMQVSILVCALGLVGLTAGQIIQLGKCRDIPVVQDFDVDEYMGLWHQIEAYPAFFETGSCVNATYTLNNDTGDVDVYNSQVVLGILSSINGTAALTTDDGSAKLDVTFKILDLFNVSSNYWVLATDYTSYALVYSCAEINSFTRAVFSWKLSRTNTLTDEAKSVIDNIVSNTSGLSQRYYQTTNRSARACRYFL